MLKKKYCMNVFKRNDFCWNQDSIDRQSFITDQAELSKPLVNADSAVEGCWETDLRGWQFLNRANCSMTNEVKFERDMDGWITVQVKDIGKRTYRLWIKHNGLQRMNEPQLDYEQRVNMADEDLYSTLRCHVKKEAECYAQPPPCNTVGWLSPTRFSHLFNASSVQSRDY